MTASAFSRGCIASVIAHAHRRRRTSTIDHPPRRRRRMIAARSPCWRTASGSQLTAASLRSTLRLVVRDLQGDHRAACAARHNHAQRHPRRAGSTGQTARSRRGAVSPLVAHRRLRGYRHFFARTALANHLRARDQRTSGSRSFHAARRSVSCTGRGRLGTTAHSGFATSCTLPDHSLAAIDPPENKDAVGRLLPRSHEAGCLPGGDLLG